ncbi:MAG: 4'-phosphopantetheinyl transferase family protein [Acetivibrionales bacterium]|jgi:4'-phosphopantetheinyl transferase
MLYDSNFSEKEDKGFIYYIDSLDFRLPGELLTAYVSFCRFKRNYKSATACNFLNEGELEYFKSLSFQRRRNSYLLGRYAAKMAVSSLANEEDLKKIVIRNGVFNHPVLKYGLNNIQISITHCEDIGAAIAFSDMLLLGLDIERNNPDMYKVMEREMTQFEKELANRMPISYGCFLVMAWTLKESLSKVLKTGLTIPTFLLEIKDIEIYNDYFICKFSNFPQYNAVSFFCGNYCCSISYPGNIETLMNIDRIKNNVDALIKYD